MTRESQKVIDWPAVTLNFSFGALFGLIPALNFWYFLDGVIRNAWLAIPMIAVVFGILAAWKGEVFWDCVFGWLKWFAWW